MKTLQEHYNAIQNGKGGNKAQFLRQARQLFPQYINQYSDFDTATRVLKSKQVISEANAGGVVSKGFDIFDWKKILAEEVKAEEKETSKEVKDANKNSFQPSDMKNADNINFNEIMKGFYAELKDEKNHNKTAEEIKAMVVKNLAKDPLYYTKDGEFGTKGVGYTVDAPGLGEPKEPKGKHKSSGYGDLDTDKKVEKVKSNVQDSLGEKEAKTSNPSKVKEMEVAPQNSPGVKKMKMPGAEKKIKLKENIEQIEETINKKYTHFAIRKSDNKIVNGWETISDVDSLKYYAKMDLKDIFPDSKISDFIIYSKNALIKKGIDPFDIKNWESYKADKVDETDIHGVAGNPDEEVEYKKAQIKILDPISAQIADLEQELMSTTDPERKAEIELKIKELQSGLQEEKLRVLIREIIEEEITKR